MALGFIRCNEINPAIKIEFTGRLCYNKNKTNYITARKAINMAIKKKTSASNVLLQLFNANKTKCC